MVITLLVGVISVVDNHHHTVRVTTLTDTSHMLPGVLEAMDHSMVTVVPEVVKVSW
tara:strand:- start:355 stop:522 length:168 start_codon:yes stop_codon:yes gene_type:complete